MERPLHYILVGKTPVVEHDLIKWAEWMENIDSRKVNLTKIFNYEISTVFLGLDHNWSGDPLLFETMVFERYDTPKIIEFERPTTGEIVRYEYTREDARFGTYRYTTWDQAELGHREVVKEVRKQFVKVVNGEK